MINYTASHMEGTVQEWWKAKLRTDRNQQGQLFHDWDFFTLRLDAYNKLQGLKMESDTPGAATCHVECFRDLESLANIDDNELIVFLFRNSLTRIKALHIEVYDAFLAWWREEGVGWERHPNPDMRSLNSSARAQSWRRLSSDGLLAHAFAAASTTVDPVDGTEKLWIMGGTTQNCAQDAPAYVWSASVGNTTAGKWSAVYLENGVSPSCRRGATAVTFASTNATSVMISGSKFDASTCASACSSYVEVDLWCQSSSSSSYSLYAISSKSTETTHVGNDMMGTAYALVQSLALDPCIREFSLSDYMTVFLPANGTYVATGDWEHWNAAGLIPAGCMGHTAVVTPKGKVFIHGGYLQDPSKVDIRVVKASTACVPLCGDGGRVMVVSFGKPSDGPAASYSGQSFLAAGSTTPMHYLDTATLMDAGGLTWSTSAAGVAQARKVVANTASAAAPIQATPVTAPSTLTSVRQTPEASPIQESPATSPLVEPNPQAATPASTKASVNVENKPNPNIDVSGNTAAAPTGSSHTSAIAGSFLGVATIAAAVGGIYAYRKRKKVAAYNLSHTDTGNSGNSDADLAGFHMGDEEKGMRGLSVSKLYLRPDEMKEVPLIAAAAGGVGSWSARLERASGMLTKSNSTNATVEEDRYTAAPKAVMTLPNGAPLAQMMGGEKTDLLDDFITLFIVEDEPLYGVSDAQPLVCGELLHPLNDSRMETKLDLMQSNTSRASLATVSSIDSHTAASHFSYPCMSGMQRGSPHLWYNETNTDIQCFQSLFLDFDPNQIHLNHNKQDLDSTISINSVSTAPNPIQALLFPWSTPTVAAPSPTKISDSTTETSSSMHRSKRTSLRITNAC
uniref:Uncharacterized protein n=1 Tax=Ustilago esculenta TaxID=185366 RepID=A0A481SFU2_9BASI|nr:hypothetical protein UEMT_2054 [Ustilago esculenta]